MNFVLIGIVIIGSTFNKLLYQYMLFATIGKCDIIFYIFYSSDKTGKSYEKNQYFNTLLQ